MKDLRASESAGAAHAASAAGSRGSGARPRTRSPAPRTRLHSRLAASLVICPSFVLVAKSDETSKIQSPALIKYTVS